MLEVHPVLNLLIEFKVKSKNLVALVEHSLCEEGNELDGRACGDGVAVIGYNYKAVEQQHRLEDLIETVIHECLHTLGFDHCLAWRCVMNGVVGQEIWPCPACMLKLESELTVSVKEWYRQLTQTFAKYKLKRFLIKGEKILNILEND
jgi:predicted Zn-dependent protease